MIYRIVEGKRQADRNAARRRSPEREAPRGARGPGIAISITHANRFGKQSPRFRMSEGRRIKNLVCPCSSPGNAELQIGMGEKEAKLALGAIGN